MKVLFVILLLLFCVSLFGYDGITQDKFYHFSANFGMYVLADYVCDMMSLPVWIPVTLCVGVSFGKELSDPIFSWDDIVADGFGMSFGFLIRLK